MAYTKRIVIIAGPNGAGKTTFAREFLPTDAELPNFVNADLIAAGLSPFAPDLAAFKAGRIMLETIADYAKRGESFSFETTLSGLSYAQMIPVWRSSGYLINGVVFEYFCQTVLLGYTFNLNYSINPLSR